jgi:hypothetical protein
LELLARQILEKRSVNVFTHYEYKLGDGDRPHLQVNPRRAAGGGVAEISIASENLNGL